jgi:hypothetical protein
MHFTKRGPVVICMPKPIDLNIIMIERKYKVSWENKDENNLSTYPPLTFQVNSPRHRYTP